MCIYKCTTCAIGIQLYRYAPTEGMLKDAEAQQKPSDPEVSEAIVY